MGNQDASLVLVFPTPDSQVFQGLLRAHPEFHNNKNNITRLWIHECFRWLLTPLTLNIL